MKPVTYLGLLAVFILAEGFSTAYAGDSPATKRAPIRGLDTSYGYNPGYEDYVDYSPHGHNDNRWLSRLMEGCPDIAQKGWIRVSSPQVYSRQLVFRDRAEETQFLSDRLKATRDFHLKYQGIVDARFYEALAQQLAVQFDPASGKIIDQQQRNLLQNAQQQGMLTSLQNEVTLLNLRQQLALATNTLANIEKNATPGTTPGSTAPAQPDPATQQQIQQMQAQIDDLKKKIAALTTAPVASVASTNAVKPELNTTDNKPLSPVLSTGGAAAATPSDKLGLTGIEEEKSILEVRRFLQNERRRLSFDDMHDAGGSITLELGMLVTLLPPKNEDAYAILEVTVEKPDAHDDQNYNYSLLTQRWADYLAPAIQSEVDLISLRYKKGYMPPTEKFMQLATALHTDPGKNQKSNSPENSIRVISQKPSDKLASLNTTLRVLSSNQTQQLASSQPFMDQAVKNNIDASDTFVRGSSSAKPEIEPEVMNRYLQLYFGECFMEAFQQHQGGAGRNISDGVKEELYRFLNWTDKGVKVLAVDPTETAQNISMVGSTQSVRNIILSLNALLSGGVQGSARNDYYRDSQMYLQSINRKPLAVGFANGAAIHPSFGWVLGPRYQVELKRRWYQLGFLGEPRPTPTFSHEPTTHQVQVVISLPSWVPRLLLKVKAHWVDSRTGLPVKSLNTPHVFVDDYPLPSPSTTTLQNSRTYSDCAARIPVNLEPDFAALTEGLLDYVHGKRRPPRIFMQESINDKFILSTSQTTEGTKHHLVVLGKDLWRNPTVYLDSLPASSVEIMPGLVGVVATFDSLPPSDDSLYNVTVSTNGGFDSIPDIVNALGGKSNVQDASSNATPELALQTHWLKHDYTAAMSDTNNINLTLQVAKNPYPVIPPHTYLTGTVGMNGAAVPTAARAAATLTAMADGGILMAINKVDSPAKSLAALLPGLGADGANAVKIIARATMPLQGTDSQDDVVLKNVIKGDREIVLFKNDEALKFVLKASTTTPGTYNLASPDEQLVTLQLADNVAGNLFAQAFPEYAKALTDGKLSLQLAPSPTSPKITLCRQTSANSLVFKLPSQSEAVKLYDLKAGNLSVTLAGQILVGDPVVKKFDLKNNVILSIPTP